MKRNLAQFLMVLCLIFVVFINAAAAETEIEILFRGNEWGSSYTEVMRSFPSESKWRTLTVGDFSAVEAYLWDDSSAEQYKTNVGGWTNMYYDTFDKELIVAGYPVHRVNLHFAFLPEGNGIISESNPRTALIYASYRFTPASIDAMFDNLSNKLESLYGGTFRDVEKESRFGNTKYRIWEGANKTYVTLATTYDGEVQIRYGYEGGNELLKVAQDSRILEENIANPLDVDGL